VSSESPFTSGQILTGALFSEPMRVETVRANGAASWVAGLVGTQSERFRKVTLTAAQVPLLTVLEPPCSFDGDSQLLRLGLQARALGIAYEFDPYFGLSISRVDPLPHQLEAVYDYLLKLARVRFLLADDAGAGKTLMSGLLIRELELRGLAERILIVCPANLAFQWQRELNEKFDIKLLVMKGRDLREQFGVNQWIERNRVITSLDLAKRTDVLPSLRQVHWDLVIVDEAQRMSAADESHKSPRYRLEELLRDTTDHMLLLTATPHKGDPLNFSLFLQLLDSEAHADVKSIREAMDRRRAPFYLRRTKAAMVYFPERRTTGLDAGTWAAEPIFTRRIPHTVDFQIDGAEFELYRDATRFVERESVRAAAAGEDPRARAIGFLMSLYQRRLASSTFAMRRSLENRAHRLEDGLKRAQDLAGLAPPDLPDPEELEEMEASERERLEALLEAVTLAGSADRVRQEVQELRRLAAQAKAVETDGVEAELSELRALLQKEGFCDHADQRLLLFTEFEDTLDYLVAHLRDRGFQVGFIHGGMKSGSRDEPGTRLHAEQQFREGQIQVLVATEAAGEGINLRVCNILFNYDIPWNPNRLEQRMGRIHGYGQRKDCLIFNFVATNTIAGRVLQRLLEKLQEIRDALDDDAVFNVVGEILPSAHVERVLRDYYAGRLGDADLEDRLLRNVDERQFRAICQNALEGLASKKLNLEMLIERRARAQERRVVPETIARFLTEAAECVPLALKPVPQLLHAFDPAHTPSTLRQYEREPDWRLPALADRYPRCSTDRDTAETEKLEWVTPGHPLFEAIRRHTQFRALEALAKGATFYSLQHDRPARIDFFRARVVDDLGTAVHERLFAVEVPESGEPRIQEPGLLGNFIPASCPDELPSAAYLPEPSGWLHDHALQPFLQEVAKDRLGEIERVANHVELSLTELLQRADEEIGRAAGDVETKLAGEEGRLAMAEARHAELLARGDGRRVDLQRERALSLQAVQRLASVLVLPHPESESPEVGHLEPDIETEAIAMRVVMEHESALGRQLYDVSERNLGYDVTSLDLASGELRLIAVKGLGGATGAILPTPNERRVAQDRRDCFWLYLVTHCKSEPRLEQIFDPASRPWHEVSKVSHYFLSDNALLDPAEVREPDPPPYGSEP
jgi:superfamily II DNA or RNA helicase